jgi:hypothetical protein
MPWQFLGDAVLVVHFGVVLFVIGGLLVIPTGNAFGWPWVNAWTFRIAHVTAIAVVAVQAWLGQVCPLTTLEMHLRERAGKATYAGSFVEHWLAPLLFHDLPAWVFVLVYTAFGSLVAAAWIRFPPGRSGR